MFLEESLIASVYHSLQQVYPMPRKIDLISILKSHGEEEEEEEEEEFKGVVLNYLLFTTLEDKTTLAYNLQQKYEGDTALNFKFGEDR